MDIEVTFRQSPAQAKAKPDNPSEECEESDSGDKVSHDKVSYPFNRSAVRPTLADNLNNVVEPERE